METLLCGAMQFFIIPRSKASKNRVANAFAAALRNFSIYLTSPKICAMLKVSQAHTAALMRKATSSIVEQKRSPGR